MTIVGLVAVATQRPSIADTRHRPAHRVADVASVAKVVATSPASGAAGVAPTAKLVLALSRPLAPDVPPPSLTPDVAGTWSSCGHDELCFTPSVPFPLGTTETVVVPLAVARPPIAPTTRRRADGHVERHTVRRSATTDLVRTAGVTDMAQVSRTFELSFSTATASIGLAQVLLAQLGYLPLELPTGLAPVASSQTDAPGSTSPPSRATAAGDGGEATTTRSVPASTSASSPTLQAVTDADPALALTWRYDDVPASVHALWQPGVDSTMTKGAIVQFERVHDLQDGSYPPYGTSLTSAFWQDLVTSAMAGADDPHPYTVAEVSEVQPERLTLWSDGADELTTLVNTGIPGGATPTGAFFVYLRYVSQTMHGYTVTGQPYVYPNVPDVNYFSGNFAIHGFPRAAYGFPQSQGCVEVPLAEAPLIYRDLDYGSLVVIS